MSHRLWYPQLDVYDAIRRIASILSLWPSTSSASLERLYIVDFYLANPPLLHKTQMTSEFRSAFNALSIPRPEQRFLSYPSAPVLFQKMEAVQRQAVFTITGKGLLDLAAAGKGEIVPTPIGKRLFSLQFLPLLDEHEWPVAKFLMSMMADASTCDMATLRGRTGLRRLS
jgi:hypothetical protein